MQKINFQRPLKSERTDGKQLLIHSVFFTIQGEGPHAGKPAVFVRLGGCNLQCPGCDTEYTAGAAFEDIASILTRVRMAFGDYGGQLFVVITGGEPFRQNIIPLVNELIHEGFMVQVESNGTLGMDEAPDFKSVNFEVVVSPKAGRVHVSLWPYITAYKYVLDIVHIDPEDGLPSSMLGLPGRPARPHIGFSGDVYVQPADERDAVDNKCNLQACVGIAKRFGYRVGIQTHKLMGVE